MPTQSSGLKIKQSVIQSNSQKTTHASNGQNNLEMTVLNQFPHDNSFYDRNVNGVYKIN